MSSKRAASQSPSAVVDTVVLHYFLLVDQAQLLLRLLGSPIGVPRIVYDPEDGAAPERAQSEISEGISYHRRSAADPARIIAARRTSKINAERLGSIAAMHDDGHVAILDLRPRELGIMSTLTSQSGCKGYGLVLPLGAGEAACLALGTSRGLAIATDDGDALKALAAMSHQHPYERIRRLLMRGAEEGLISRVQANEIHAAMRALGFRDMEAPFPAA